MIDAAIARRIRLVGFDVDGVLTDGGIYLGDVDGARMEFKRYDIQDGIGMMLLRYAGIKVVIVTGRVSQSAELRAKELHVDDFSQDPNGFKLASFQRMLVRFGVAPGEAAFVGDDFPDIPILRVVGLPVSVNNASPEVRDICSVNLSREGGRGAAREFCELLLKARGEWANAHERYVSERSAAAGSPP